MRVWMVAQRLINQMKKLRISLIFNDSKEERYNGSNSSYGTSLHKYMFTLNTHYVQIECIKQKKRQKSKRNGISGNIYRSNHRKIILIMLKLILNFIYLFDSLLCCFIL